MPSAAATISTVLTAVSLVGCGVTSGLLFTFSFFALQALNTLHTEAAIAAMNAINLYILQPAFFLFFLGPAATSAALLIAAAIARNGTAAEPLRLIAAVLYIFGVIGVTMGFNVPLNKKLKAVDAKSTEQGSVDAAVWDNFYTPWLWWNHVRTASAIIACTLFAAALTR